MSHKLRIHTFTRAMAGVAQLNLSAFFFEFVFVRIMYSEKSTLLKEYNSFDYKTDLSLMSTKVIHIHHT